MTAQARTGKAKEAKDAGHADRADNTAWATDLAASQAREWAASQAVSRVDVGATGGDRAKPPAPRPVRTPNRPRQHSQQHTMESGMFTLVLLALTDKTEGTAAARLASASAARHGAGFAVQHVSGPVGQEGGCVLQLPGDDVLTQRRAKVEALLRDIMPAGLTADVVMSVGFAHLEILKTARILGPDLLVLGGLDEAERCRKELSASSADAATLVAHAAACPVLVVPSGADVPSGPFGRILVYVDSSDHKPEQTHTLLGFAARLARREGAELHLLHALPLHPGQPTPSHEEMTRRVGMARDRLAYLCQGLPGADRFSISVSEGAASVEMLKHARERKADLLVIALRNNGQSGTTAQVLEGARRPVMLLGPAALGAQSQARPPEAEG